MPRHRTHNSRMVYVFPDDFPQRLERFKEESGLTWAEIARRVGTSDLNLRRWREGVRPHWRHLAALLELAEDFGLGRLFTDWGMGLWGRVITPALEPVRYRAESRTPWSTAGKSRL